MVDSQPEIDALLRRTQQGDAKALGLLFEHFYPEIHIIARGHMRLAGLRAGVRPFVSIDDLVQTACRALLEVFRQQRFQVPSVGALVNLVKTILTHKVSNLNRKQGTRDRRLGPAVSAGERESALAEAPDPRPGPVCEAQLAELLRALEGSLEPLDRRILELKMQGCPSAEAAEQLGLSSANLRMRLSRLRASLKAKDFLAPWLEDR